MDIVAADPTSDLADLIIRDIQSGAYAPGAWLKQIDLETRYKRSRLDIRRALDRLVQRRVVVHEPNRGYHVHGEDDERANQIRDVRLILEHSAAPDIVARASADDIDHLEVLAHRFDTATLEGTMLEQYDANIAFHLALLSIHPNQELASLVTDLRNRISSAPANQWRSRRRVEQSSREHFQMVEAVRRRDATELQTVIRAHILQLG